MQWVSSQMGISPAAAKRNLTDDALTDLARTMAFSVADETPGAGVLGSARTAAVPVPILGRCIAGLAEAIQIRLRERDEVEHLRTTVAQIAPALSAVGQVTSEHTSDRACGAAVVMMPAGLVNRVARYLEAAAISSTRGCCRKSSAQPMRASSPLPSNRTPPVCATTPPNTPASERARLR